MANAVFFQWLRYCKGEIANINHMLAGDSTIKVKKNLGDCSTIRKEFIKLGIISVGILWVGGLKIPEDWGLSAALVNIIRSLLL